MLSPASPTAIPTGRAFAYTLQWKCAGSISPADDCIDMQIVDVLPPYIEFVSAAVAPEVSSVNPVVDGTGNTTVVLNFQHLVMPGISGTVELQVRYKPGQTPNGVASPNTATISAAGVAPVASSPPVVTTSVVDRPPTIAKSASVRTAGNLLRYVIDYCGGTRADPEGSLAVTGATITDTLPPGTTYLSASPAPTSAPAVGGTGTVTWSGLPGIEAGSCRSVVLLLKNSLNVGDSVTNTADVTLTLWDGSLFQAPATHTTTLEAPDYSGAWSNKDCYDKIFVNGPVGSCTIGVRNEGNLYYDRVAIEDVFPPSADVQYFVTYDSGFPNEDWFVQIDDGPWVDVTSHYSRGASQALSKAELIDSGVMTGAQYITAFRRVVQGMENQFSYTYVRFNGINPDRFGHTATLPVQVSNTASVVFTLDGVDQATQDRSDSYLLSDPVPAIAPAVLKTSTSGPVVPGGTQGWRLHLGTYNGEAAKVGIPADLLNPTVVDLLPSGFSYAGNLTFDLVSNTCQTAPQVTTIDDYNGSGRQLVVFSYAGKVPACAFGHVGDSIVGQAFSIGFDTRVAPGTPAATYANTMAITNWENPPQTQVQHTSDYCDNSLPDTRYAASFTGSTGSADPGRICESRSANAVVQSSASFSSRKGVTGQLDAGVYQYSGSGNVATTVRGGTMMWTARITNTGNVDATQIDIVDILPTAENGSNTGVGTGTPMGSTWTPYFLTPVAPPPGGTVYYSTDANPCRDNIVAVPGCQPMVTLAPGVAQNAAGQWSTVLPVNPRTVRSFRIHFGAAVLAGGQRFDFTWPMSAPADAPFAADGTDAMAATIDDSNVAWNTFGYSLETALGPLNSAPTRVGIIVKDVPAAAVASYGNYVWFDTNRDGLQNEPAANGLNNVRVDLYRDDDGDGDPATGTQTLIGTQLTAGDAGGNPGYYLFPGLSPGAYYAQFYPPAAYPVASTANSNGNLSDALDSDGQPVAGQPYLRSHVTMLVAGQDYRDTDQGFYAAAAQTIDLALAKTVTSSGPYMSGSTVSYSLVARNIGPATAQPGIVVRDRLPAGLNLVSVSGTNWSCLPATGTGPLDVTCTRSASAAALAAGTSAEGITVTARVAAGAGATLVNLAQVAPAAGETLAESNPLSGVNGGYEDGNPATGSNNDDSKSIAIAATPPGGGGSGSGGGSGATPWPIPMLHGWLLLLLTVALGWMARPIPKPARS